MKIQKTFTFLIALYSVALLASVAALESISVILSVFAIGHGLKNFNINSIKSISPFFKWLIIFNVVLIASLFLSPVENVDWRSGLKTFKLSIWVWALYYLSVQYLNQDKVKAWVPYWFVFVSIVSIYTIIQFFFGIDIVRSDSKVLSIGDFYRPTGFFSMSLTLAYVLGMASITLLPLTRFKKSSALYAVYFLFFFLSVIAVGLTLSRGLWIAYFFSMLLSLYFIRSKKLTVASLLLLGICASVLLTNPAVKGKLLALFDPLDNSQSYRIILWQAYWQMFLDHWWLGVGWLQSEAFLPEYLDKIGHPDFKFRSHAHNNFLQLLCGGGVLALLFYLGLVVIVFKKAWQILKDRKLDFTFYGVLALISAQLLFHIGGMTEANLIDSEVGHFMATQWVFVLVFFYWENDSNKIGSVEGEDLGER